MLVTVTLLLRLHIWYMYSIQAQCMLQLHVQTRAECASLLPALLFSRTAFGLQSHRLVALSTLHALHCRSKQTLKQQKRVNSLPLKTFGTTSTKMDLEPSYDLLKSANPKSSCRHHAGVYLVSLFHSLSGAACLWQQLYYMSAKGLMQLSTPSMDYLYHFDLLLVRRSRDHFEPGLKIQV